MSTVLQRNIEYIKNKGIEIDISKKTDKVSYTKDFKGKLVPIYNINGVNKHIYSIYDADEFAKKSISTVQLKSANALIVFGAGLFYEVEKIVNQWKEEGTVIIIEPDADIFNSNILNTQFSFNTPKAKFAFYIGQEITIENIMNLVYKEIGVVNFHPVVFYSNLAYSRIYLNEYFEALKGVTEATTSLTINYNTNLEFSVKSTKLFGKGLPKFFENVIPLNAIENIYKNKPAVVVATGPSLLKNIDLLKDIQDKVVILAPYVAMKVLEPLGIKPDFVFSIDSNQVLEENHKEHGFETNFLMNITGNHEIIDKNKGINFYEGEDYYSNFDEYTTVNGQKLQSLSTGGSVANTAVAFAQYAGCNRVILIGQDLSFKGKQSHAYADVIDEIKFDRYKVKGFYGDEVETYNIYDGYKKWFQKFALETKDAIHYVNATEGGVYIENFEHMSFKDAIEKYLTEEIDKTFEYNEKCLPTINELNKVIEMLEKELKIYKSSFLTLKDAVKSSEKMVKIFNKDNDADVTKNKNDIKKLTRGMKHFIKIKDEIGFSKLIIYLAYMQDLNGYPLEYSEDRIKACKNYAFYSKTLNSFDLSIDILEKAIEELKEVKENKYGI